jgi:hypothetical protein
LCRRAARRTTRHRDRPVAPKVMPRPTRRIFMRPVKRGAGQQPDRAPVQLGVHPVAVEFDFMEPVWPIGRLVVGSAPRRWRSPAGSNRNSPSS